MNSASAKSFLDTNILVYAYDGSEPEKRRKAQDLLTRGIEEENVALSAQVLSEFFVVVTRRIQTPLSADQAKGLVGLFSILPVVEVDLKLVQQAVSLHKERGLVSEVS